MHPSTRENCPNFGVLMSVGVMTVGVMSVGEITVGVMTVGVMRQPRFSELAL